MIPIKQRLQFISISDRIYQKKINSGVWQFVVNKLWNEVDSKTDRLGDAIWEEIKCSQSI